MSLPPPTEIRKIPVLPSNERYESIHARLGDGWDDVEILTWCDEHYLLEGNHSQRALAADGTFAVSRDPANFDGRGDIGSVIKKQRSIERIGLRPELSSPPWFVKVQGSTEKVTTLHWGTRYDGLERAMAADTLKKNIYVQMGLTMSIHGCKLYQGFTPFDVKSFLTKWGNVLSGPDAP